MSAICGFINLNKSPSSIDIGNSMMSKFDIYKIDKKNILIEDNVFMGCGIQYITPESENEILPYFDKGENLIITADAIIDNRDELIEQLELEESLKNDITDSQLILQSYKKWGEECPKYLIGDFSFVIVDKKNETIFAARDHMGNRTFYYYYDKNLFAFSTTIKPILEVIGSKALNNRWLVDFLALKGVVMQHEGEETPYKNVFQLKPNHILTVKKNILDIKQYWDILSIKKIRLKNHKEYEKELLRLLNEAITCRLRTKSEVGIMLSGGLDSGSVACLASQTLDKKNKKLYAFSSIPISNFENNLKYYEIPDESEYISSITEKYKNIDIKYCRFEGKDCTSDVEEVIDTLEMPYKQIENMVWLNGIPKEASKKFCKVILTGQYGNFTISYGDFESTLVTLYRQKKFCSIIKEMYGYSKLFNVPLKNIIKYWKKQILIQKRYKNTKYNLSFEDTFLNPELIERFDVEYRFLHKNINDFRTIYLDNEEIKFVMKQLLESSIMGIVDTKIGLKNGLVFRDPTKDKRIVEFCASIPNNQFVKNGKPRLLIRNSMEGILPDKIRLNYKTRGVQGQDWMQRLNNGKFKFNNCIEELSKNRYLDFERLSTYKEDDTLNTNEIIARQILVLSIFNKFIKGY